MINTEAPPTPLSQLKAKQHQTWSSGDYGKIAWITVPLAAELCSAVDPRPGTQVLDVACGTGHVAIEAARRFCHATGIDYVPGLVEIARRRALAEGLSVDLQVADAENLPFPDDTFDAVLSAIGVMFTADHQRAAAELVRVCRSGGRIGLANWTAEGFIGRLLKTVGALVPPPPAAQPPTRWGSEEVVAELLGSTVSDVSSTTAVIAPRFESPESFADFLLTHYGPTYTASQRLDDTGRDALRNSIVSLARQANNATDDTFVTDWEYRIITATKKA
jgi:SAM-dependent methyltransferase